jgi:hypothetical protein
LCNRHFIKILQRTDFGARQLALKGRVRAFNAGDELGNFIVLRYGLRRDLLVLIVITADKPNLTEDFFRGIASEIENPVFLANSGCEQGASFWFIFPMLTDAYR